MSGAYLGGVLRVLEHPPQLGMHKIKYSLNYKHALGTNLPYPSLHYFAYSQVYKTRALTRLERSRRDSNHTDSSVFYMESGTSIRTETSKYGKVGVKKKKKGLFGALIFLTTSHFL